MLKPKPYFVVDNRQQKNGYFAIRIKQNTVPRLVLETGEYVSSIKQFDSRKQTSKDKKQAARLDDLMARIETAAKIRIDGGTKIEDVTIKQCIADLSKPIDVSSPKTNRVVDWLKFMAGRHGLGYKQNLFHLEERKQLGLLLVDLTDDYLKTYIDWLVTERKLKQSTIRKRVDCFRHTLDAAQKRGQPVPVLLDSGTVVAKMIKQGKPATVKQPLNFIELMKLIECDGLSKRQKVVRDMFLLMAFTSVRVSDLMQADRWLINNESIQLMQQKTKGLQSITLNQISRDIIKRYSVVDIATGNFLLRLPVFTNQYLNRELKDIGTLVGLPHMSTHVGRHSYARLLSDLTIPDHIQSVELGHKGKSMTAGYGRMIDDNFVRQVVGNGIRKAFDCYKKKISYSDWYFKVNPSLNYGNETEKQKSGI